MKKLAENKNLLIKFGKHVKSLRQENKLSQEELAYKAGLHRTYIGMIERGEKNITLINIEKIANAFGLPLNKLMEFNYGK
jgi:transcriptional regulator with XRE-family HTH domain